MHSGVEHLNFLNRKFRIYYNIVYIAKCDYKANVYNLGLDS